MIVCVRAKLHGREYAQHVARWCRIEVERQDVLAESTQRRVVLDRSRKSRNERLEEVSARACLCACKRSGHAREIRQRRAQDQTVQMLRILQSVLESEKPAVRVSEQ